MKYPEISQAFDIFEMETLPCFIIIKKGQVLKKLYITDSLELFKEIELFKRY